MVRHFLKANLLSDALQGRNKRKQGVKIKIFPFFLATSAIIPFLFLPIDYKNIMKLQPRFETFLPDRSRLRELREKAIIERDLLRLQQHNTKIIKILTVTLIIVLIAAITITVTALISTHFHALLRNVGNCVVQHYEGSDYFRPVCVTCQQGYQKINGTCISST